jgi:autotransporter-associated beta strand protein
MRHCALFGLTIVFVSVISPVRAQNVYTWANAGTNWGTPANWGGTVPTGADIGLFNAASYTSEPNLAATFAVGGVWSTGSGTVAVTGGALRLNASTVNGNPSTGIEMDAGAGALTFSNSLGLGGTQTWLNNSGSQLSIQGNLSTGGNTLTIAGSGNVTIGGAVSNAGNLTMAGGGTLQLYGANSFTGTTTADNGTLSMTGGSLVSPIEYVGFNGTGNFVQSGGRNALSGTASVLWLGYNSASSSGSYTLSAGTLSSVRIRMGNLGTGSFTQTGGLVAPSVALSIAFSNAASYTLMGGQLNASAANLNVGVDANGTFTQSSGSVNANTLIVGFDAVGSGTCTMNGGSFLVNKAEEIGSSGNGTFVQTGGTNTYGTPAGAAANGGVAFLDVGGGASGSYTLTDGQLLAASGTHCELNIGDSAPGSFNQAGGLVTVNNGIFMAAAATASASYTLSAGTLSTNYLSIGYGTTSSLDPASNATFTQSGGTNLVGGNILLGQKASGVGTYLLSGSGLLSVQYEVLGNDGSGTVTQSGGTNFAAAGLILGNNSDGAGTYNLNGGLLLVGGFGLQKGAGGGQLNSGGGTIQAASNNWSQYGPTDVPITLTGGNLTFDTAGNPVALGAAINGPGGLTYMDSLGVGSLILGVANSYTGGTAITSGSLQIGDPGALGSGALTVNGGTLDLSGLNIVVSGLSGGTAGTITNSGTAASASLTVSQTGTTTFGGSIQDGANPTALVVTSGKLVLDGSNTFTGGTFVSGGKLVLANDEAVPNGANVTVGDPTPFGTPLPSPVVAGVTTADARSPVSKFNAAEVDVTALSRASFDGAQSTAGSPMPTPVPEPATLGLLIASVAATASICRRGRHRKLSVNSQFPAAELTSIGRG